MEGTIRDRLFPHSEMRSSLSRTASVCLFTLDLFMSQNGAWYAKAAIPEGRRVDWWAPDKTLNGSLDDLGGLDAYHLSLGGKPAPVIDGFTGDQRFFMSWAQFWRLQFRREFTRNQLATDRNASANRVRIW